VIAFDEIILGEQVRVPGYGVGRITAVGPVSGCGGSVYPDWIGVTPYVAGYQMNFDPSNVSKHR
jgi:hypothetical protein